MQCKFINIYFDHLNMYCFVTSTFIIHYIIRNTLCMLSYNSFFLYQFSIPHPIDDMNRGVGLLLCDLTTVTSQPHLN